MKCVSAFVLLYINFHDTTMLNYSLSTVLLKIMNNINSVNQLL